MGMSSRTQSGARGARGVEEDDWFASTPPQAVERESSPWEPEPERQPPEPPHPDYSKRRAAVVLAVVIGIVLLVGGILVGRVTTSAVTETVTVTVTDTVTEQETVTADATTATTTSSSDTATTPTTSTSTTPTGSGAVPTEATLRPGTTGSSSVVALQTALTTLGYEPGAADGNYGAATAAAVSAFQTDDDLKVDGIAGPATIAAINAAVASG